MASDAVQSKRPRIVNFTLHPVSFPLFRHGCASLEFSVWQVTGFLHVQRMENLFLRELMHILTADSLHNLPENDIADVAVGETFTGGGCWPESVDSGKSFVASIFIIAH